MATAEDRIRPICVFPTSRSDVLPPCWPLGPAGAQTPTPRVVPESKAQVQLSFAPIVRQTAGSVVNVYAKRSERRQNAAIEEYFRRFFGDNAPGVPRGRSQSSLGSGVIVDPSGLVITNNHVIENMTEVKVALADRREFEAEILLRDPRTDIAVLKLKDATNLQAVELGDSEALQVGDLVLAIGNPFGVGQTVTQGIVSALARTQVGISDYQFFIQTDAAINPGNSGGALIDMNGRAGRHQHRHLFPLRRQHRHRLRRAVEHGPGGAELGARRLART